MVAIVVFGFVLPAMFLFTVIYAPLHSRKVARERAQTEADALRRRAEYEVALEDAKNEVRRVSQTLPLSERDG